MIKPIKNFLIIVFLSIVSVSCKYCSKHTIEINNDVAYLSKTTPCKNNEIPGDIKEIFRPFQLNDSIGVPIGKIYQLGTSPVTYISLTDSNYGGLVNFRKKMLNNNDTYDASLKNYDNMISELTTQILCDGNNNNNALEELNKKIIENHYKEIFVLSTKIQDTIWNNHKIFKNASVLKEHLITLYKIAPQQKILIIIDPTSNEHVEDTIQHVSQMQELLLRMGTDPDYTKRSDAKGKILDTYFANEFTITLRLEDSSSSVIYKDYKNGTEYLDNLIKHRHLENILIGNQQKNNENKITHLDVTEILKKDIPVSN